MCRFFFSLVQFLFSIHVAHTSATLIASCSRFRYGTVDERQSLQRPFLCQRQILQLPCHSLKIFPHNHTYFQDNQFSSFALGYKVAGVSCQTINCYVALQEFDRF